MASLEREEAAVVEGGGPGAGAGAGVENEREDGALHTAACRKEEDLAPDLKRSQYSGDQPARMIRFFETYLYFNEDLNLH